MAHVYAGILGLLALVTSLADGVIHARQVDAILFDAWCGLLLFAALGYVIGSIAGRVVEESVSERISAELAREQQPDETTTAPI